MSQFTGQGQRVRCVDCTNLQGTTCVVKKDVVSPKKRRSCSSYVFSGEYKNRTAAEGVYVPPVDKKTRKMIRRLIELGVVPVREDGGVAFHSDGTPLIKKTVEMPRTTATAGVVQEVSQSNPLTGNEVSEDGPIIWTPEQK